MASARAAGVGRFAGRVRSLGGSVLGEVRHLLADKPRSILARIVITLAIALSLVSFYHFTGLTRYDDAAGSPCNLAMAAMVTLPGLRVIGLLSVTGDVNPVAMVDRW